MINYKRLILIAIICLGSAFNCLGQIEALRRDVAFLADSIGNRHPGSEGDFRVRNYIAVRFSDCGLEHAEQTFDIVDRIWGEGSLRLVAGDTITDFKQGNEFVVRGRSAPDSLSAEYAVVLDSLPATLRGLLRGKVAICLSRGLKGRMPTIHELEETGVLAVIHAQPAGKGLGRDSSKGGRLHEPYKIPVLAINYNSLAMFLPQNVADTLTANVYAAPPSHRIQLCSQHHEARIKSANIIGLKRGTGKEYIIIGAHYDTVEPSHDKGVFKRGANDNASGVALMLALANRLSKIETSSNILFIAFGGEEKGCLGSLNFVSQMPLETESIKEMINLDMLGRMENQILYYKQINNTKINIADLGCSSPCLTEGLDAFSDHYDFAKKGVAVTYFNTGEDATIHTSSDTSDRLNYDGMSLALNFIFEYVIELDQI